jgi:hypothetical protein
MWPPSPFPSAIVEFVRLSSLSISCYRLHGPVLGCSSGIHPGFSGVSFQQPGEYAMIIVRLLSGHRRRREPINPHPYELVGHIVDKRCGTG